MPLAEALQARVAQFGATRVIAALAVACLVLLVLLVGSLLGNWYQFRGGARVALELTSKIAAAEARGAAELAACGATNERVNATVHALGDQLHQCRGESQSMDEALALALRQRDRARSAAEGERRQREEVIRRIYETDTDCAAWGAAPVCRARSDGMRGIAPDAGSH